MTEGQTDDTLIEQIEDLPIQAVDAQDAGQVKGGFNPQPDPPKVFIPPFMSMPSPQIIRQ